LTKVGERGRHRKKKVSLDKEAEEHVLMCKSYASVVCGITRTQVAEKCNKRKNKEEDEGRKLISPSDS
jgi:hypothetical protein